MNSKSPLRFLPPALFALGLVAAFAFTMSFPEVEGLQGRVRLPVFHGALTWVNLAGFAVLGIVAAVFLVLKRPSVYRWVEALRWTSIGTWLVGSTLGFIAALNTWDFTGSQSSPLEVAMADPRMIAQFWIVLLGLGVLALGLVLEDRRWLAVGDVAFVAIAWAVLLRAVLGPGRALHPDSPVLNSEELFIKLMFFGIVFGLGIAFSGAVWWIASVRGRSAGKVASTTSEALPDPA